MDNFLIKMFGVNRFNFFGWVVAGLVVIVAALGNIVVALLAGGAAFTPELFLLVSINILLLGIFGVLLQLYGSLLTEKLEKRQQDEYSRNDQIRVAVGEYPKH